MCHTVLLLEAFMLAITTGHSWLPANCHAVWENCVAYTHTYAVHISISCKAIGTLTLIASVSTAVRIFSTALRALIRHRCSVHNMLSVLTYSIYKCTCTCGCTDIDARHCAHSSAIRDSVAGQPRLHYSLLCTNS